MGNVERARRHLSSSNVCPVYDETAETLEHLFRDCECINRLWRSIGAHVRFDEFFSLPFATWFRGNVSSSFNFNSNITWRDFFAEAVWNIWKWRNNTVFRGAGRPRDGHKIIEEKCSAFIKAWRLHNKNDDPRGTVTTLITWTKPSTNWMKVNTDGSVKSSGRASAGGIIRNDKGKWYRGFVHNIGICTVPTAELWGMVHGLEFSWDLGIRM